MLRCCLLYSFGLVLYFWVICVGLITHWSVLHGAGFCHMSYDDRRQWQGLLLLLMIVFSFIQCLLDALTGVWHSLTVGESRSYFCLALMVQGVFAVCCTTCIICCTVFMAGLAVSNGLSPVAGANLGQELMSKYLDWLPDEEAFDQLLGLFVFNVVMNQNLSSVHSYWI